MNIASKKFVLGITLAALFAAAAIGLGACGTSGQADDSAGTSAESASSSAPEIADSTSDELEGSPAFEPADGAASDQTGDATSTSAATEASEAEMSGPVWVVSSSIYYNEEGYAHNQTTYTRDAQGNIVSYKHESPDLNLAPETWLCEDLTPEGYPQLTYRAGGSPKTAHEYTIENGRIVLQSDHGESGAGDTKTSYTYHPNGIMASMTVIVSDSATRITEWDENGFQVAYYFENDQGVQDHTTYEWTFDDQGFATGYTRQDIRSGYSSDSENGEKTRQYQVQCDDYGNTVAVYDENGQVFSEYEYVQIDDPSPATWIEAHKHKLGGDVI